MRDHIGIDVLEQVTSGLALRRKVAQEAFDAYEFEARISVLQPLGGFFFHIHKQQPVLARKIHVTDGDGPAIAGFFCVAFEPGTSRVTEAYAFTGKDDYFGRLPDEFIDAQAVATEPPKLMM